MKIEIKDHLLYLDGVQVPFHDTPNKSGKTMVPEYIIEHFTADNSPSATINWFMNKLAQASAHLLIDREGKVYQFGKFNMVLWHAGVSAWEGYNGLNSHSIGIENTNLGKVSKPAGASWLTHKNESKPAYWQNYTDIQMDVCAAVTQAVVAAYSIKEVIGHEDIAPIRKSDPGPAFPWDKIRGHAPVVVKNLFTVNATVLNLRTESNADSTILSRMPNGLRVEEIEREGEWSKVTYSGFTGWASNKFLTKVP